VRGPEVGWFLRDGVDRAGLGTMVERGPSEAPADNRSAPSGALRQAFSNAVQARPHNRNQCRPPGRHGRAAAPRGPARSIRAHKVPVACA